MSQNRDKTKNRASISPLSTQNLTRHQKNDLRQKASIVSGWLKLSFSRGTTKFEASTEFSIAREHDEAALLKKEPVHLEKYAKLVLFGIGSALVKAVLTLLGMPPL